MFDSATPQAQHFDTLFRASDDPWHFRTRWYEARKRAMTMACLPAARYVNGFEPGCANGELSAELALRCDRLLVSDVAERAVALARTRLAPFPHVQAVQAQLPSDWPDDTFDLIVISELGYFVDASRLESLADRARASLRPGGTVLACHWRRPIAGCTLDGDAVHSCLTRRLDLSVLTEVKEADFVLNVWSNDARSVAQREGFDW